MQEYIVTVHYDDQTTTRKCAPGTTLLQALESEERSRIDTPCGGKGLCGKCLVKVIDGSLSPLSETERAKLSAKEIEDGYRLACIADVEGDVSLELPSLTAHIAILEKGVDFDGPISPLVKRSITNLDEPSLEDQRNDLSRLKAGLGLPEARISLSLLKKIPMLLRENGHSVSVLHSDEEILDLSSSDEGERTYGIAVDIGTTTVVCYLIHSESQKPLDVASGLNVQKAYGQDVISRINHTLTSPTGLDELNEGIIKQLNELIAVLCSRNNLVRDHITSITVAGNTTMMHLFAGLPPKHIAAAPFIPVALEEASFTPGELGIEINEAGRIFLMPGISGYIGADISSAILASGMYGNESLSLLIDIGTNGEIVLGNEDFLVSCSTAAGPAFEGATIRDGVGGIAGAINTFHMGESKLGYTTIADEKPLGICGSGIVDAISTLLYAGIIDETGRMVKGDDVASDLGKTLAPSLTEFEGQAAFELVPAEETRHGDPILLTQKDVREVQNAKASIAAGILTLIKKAGKEIGDISTVYLAGGFGSYIDKHHAVHLGLIPGELENRIRVIGNAAGSGAVMGLLSADQYRFCAELARETEYVELSSSPEFMEDYVNSMMFPV